MATKNCEHCEGTGREIGSDSIECPVCHGNGFTGERVIEKEEVVEETAAPEKKEDPKKEDSKKDEK